MSSTFSDELSCHTATVETSTDSVVCSPVGAEEVQEMEQIQSPVSVITCDEESGGVNPSIGPSDDQQLTLRPPCSPFRASQASLSSPDLEANSSNQISNSNKRMKDLQKKKESLEAKRERWVIPWFFGKFSEASGLSSLVFYVPNNYWIRLR